MFNIHKIKRKFLLLAAPSKAPSKRFSISIEQFKDYTITILHYYELAFD